MKWARDKSRDRLKDVLREETRCTCGDSLLVIVSRLNRRLRGWYGYFRGGVRTLYARLDAWLRMRLRSLLRWRAGREGRGRGQDHQRYPNAYFAELGLVSLHERALTERTRPAACG